MRGGRWGRLICPSCATSNRDEALFCKYCGADVSKVSKPEAPSPLPAAAPPVPPAAPPPPPHITPRPVRPRAWWHPLGVFVILSAFFLVLDASATGRLTWSLVVVLSIAFIVGGIAVAVSLRRAGRTPVAG